MIHEVSKKNNSKTDLVPEDFHEKIIVLKNWVKNHLEIFLIKLSGIQESIIQNYLSYTNKITN